MQSEERIKPCSTKLYVSLYKLLPATEQLYCYEFHS